MLFALSETSQVILACVSAFFAFLTTVATGVIGIYMAKLNTKQADAAKAANEVKQTLATTTSQQDDKLGEIHDLVNSAMLEQKKMHAIKCRAAAKENPTPANLSEADQAEAIHEAHRKTKDAMDAKKAMASAFPPNGPQT